MISAPDTSPFETDDPAAAAVAPAPAESGLSGQPGEGGARQADPAGHADSAGRADSAAADSVAAGAGTVPVPSGVEPAATSVGQPAAPLSEPAAADAGGSSDRPSRPGGAQPPPLPAAPVADCGPLLKKTFPALFAGGPKPLKLRIQVDIQERAPGLFSKQALSAFFRRHTGSTSYLIAVSRAKHRFDLDGAAAGELSEEHRQIALDELARRRGNTESRAALEEQQRRNRATLLHDFERTTLTPANFCALKGIAVDELEGYLSTARREAAERPPNPRAFDRPPGPPHRADARPAQANRADGRPGPSRRADARPAPSHRADGAPGEAERGESRRPPHRPGTRPADAGRPAPRRR